jgi:DNA primase
MISPEEIEKVKSASDIFEVVGRFVVLKKRGRNYLGLCPFHQEKSPSFTVSPDKQIWHCFGCGQGGNVFNFLMRIDNLSFVEAVKQLAQEKNITITETQGQIVRATHNVELELLEKVTNFFEQNLNTATAQSEVIKYIAGRDIKGEQLKTFRIGYALESWDHLLSHFQAEQEKLLNLGLIGKSEKTGNYFDMFRHRLIFPIQNTKGQVVGFTSRIIKETDTPKYLNSPESPWFNKSQLLYGWTQAQQTIKNKKQAIVVEGNMDVIRLHEFGFTESVAAMGTALTFDHLRFLKRYVEQIYFCFDGDTAGRATTLKALHLALSLEFNAKVIVLSGAKDPDEFLVKNGMQGKVAFDRHIKEAVEAFQYLIDADLNSQSIQTIEDKQQVVRKLKVVFALMKSLVIKNHYLAYAAQKLKIEREVLERELIETSGRGATINYSSKAKPLINSKQLIAERMALKACLNSAENRNRIFELLSVKNFTDPKHQLGMERLQAASDKFGAEWIELLPPTEQKYFRELLIDEVPIDQKSFSDCVMWLKKQEAGLKRDELLDRLRDAENKGDHETAAQILNEISNFSVR